MAAVKYHRENLNDLLLVFDAINQHFRNLIKIIENDNGNDEHALANEVLKIDMNLIEIQKRLKELRKHSI